MMVRWFVWGGVLAALCIPRLAAALTIGFEPTSQVVALGDPASVELRISGLGSGAAPSLGVFDLIVDFDPAILAFSGASFGDPLLGDQLDLFALGSVTDVDAGLPGSVRLFELSLDSPSDLDMLQASAFTLATLSFDTIGLGTSALELSVASLGDAYGRPLVAKLNDGFITAVPEPSAALVFLLGLIAVRRAALRG